MKIVLIGTAYPMRGGIAHYIALLYNALKERGHKVWVVSFSRQYPKILFPGKTQQDEGKELISVRSKPILDSVNPISWLRTAMWIWRIRPDIVIFKYWMPFFAFCYAAVSLIIKLYSRTRVVYICDNITPHERIAGTSILTRIALGFVDSYIVQSRSVLNDLLHYKPNASFFHTPHPLYTIFPSGMGKKEAREKLGIKEGRVILYFGYIRRYKGLRYLIEAMPGVLERLSVRLLICGEFYDQREEIFDSIDRLGLNSCVTIYDKFIPNEMVGVYFSAADLVVLPYISATQSGIVQIAYNYNRPVVVTNVGGLPEVVKNNQTGFVVPPKCPEAIAEAIIDYYKKNLEKRFSKNIISEKKKYSWDKMVEAIETLGVRYNES